MIAIQRVGFGTLILVLTLLIRPAMAGVVMIPIVIPMPPPTVPTASTGGYDDIHNVAIVSSLGASLTLHYHDFWGDHTKPLDISAWDLDGKIAGLLKGYLGKRFTFKDAAYDRAKLAAIPNGPLVNTERDVSKYLRGLDNTGLDAFLVVRPDLNQQLPGTEGLGLDNGGAFNNPLPVEWANYEVEFFDAHTYKLIASAYSRIALHKDEKASFAGLVTSSILTLDHDLTPKPRQIKILKAITGHLVTASLIETLRAMQLGVALPDPGARRLAPIPADKMPYKNIKTIAVASNVGGAMDFERRGFLSKLSKAVQIPGWKLNTLMEHDARTTLARRFTVKDISIDRAAFANARMIDKNKKFAPDFSSLKPRDDVDAYLLFMEYPGSVLSGMAGMGTGLAMDSSNAGPRLFAHYAALLVDAHTLKIISVLSARCSPVQPCFRPNIKVDDSLWPKKPDAMTESESAAIEARLRPLLADSVQETLLDMGLTGMRVDYKAPPVPGTAAAAIPETGQTAPPAPSNPAPSSPHEGTDSGGGL